VTEPPSDEPRNAIEGAADAGLKATAAELERLGLELDVVFVLVRTTSDARPNAASAGTGFDDAADLVVTMLAHFEAAARAIGLDVMIGTMPKRGHG
jgi:hypothetical protein